jgi:hypothetical protein
LSLDISTTSASSLSYSSHILGGVVLVVVVESDVVIVGVLSTAPGLEVLDMIDGMYVEERG